jgi:hypothetical protein
VRSAPLLNPQKEQRCSHTPASPADRSTPVDPAVADAAMPYLRAHFGNPSSTHAYAEAPRRAVAAARERLAGVLGCRPGEVTFTGSGSEADTLAIHGVAFARRDHGDHVITQATEHPAVLNACHALADRHGFRVTTLPVDHHGRVDPAALDAAITPRTVLVTHRRSPSAAWSRVRSAAVVAIKPTPFAAPDAVAGFRIAGRGRCNKFDAGVVSHLNRACAAQRGRKIAGGLMVEGDWTKESFQRRATAEFAGRYPLVRDGAEDLVLRGTVG